MKFVFRHNDKHRETYLANAVSSIQGLDPGKDWQVEIKEHKEPYSGEQRAALWGLAYRVVADATGNSPDDLHEFFLGEFFGWRTIQVLDHTVHRPARTTTTDFYGKRNLLSKAELADYFTFIQSRAALMGISIPDPDPTWKQRMREAA